MNNRPKWFRVTNWLAGAWSVLVIGLIINAVMHTPSFEAAATAPCSQFLIPISEPVERELQRIDSRLFFPIVRWRDRLSHEDITPFRRGEQALSCDVIERRARLFLLGARQGAIEPEISVHKRRLSILIGIPCCLFMIGSYLVFGGKEKDSTSSEVRRQD